MLGLREDFPVTAMVIVARLVGIISNLEPYRGGLPESMILPFFAILADRY